MNHRWATQFAKREPGRVLELEGEAEIVSQEGGYGAPYIEIDRLDLASELAKLLDEDRAGRYRLRVTVDLLEDRGPVRCTGCELMAAKYYDLCPDHLIAWRRGLTWGDL